MRLASVSDWTASWSGQKNWETGPATHHPCLAGAGRTPEQPWTLANQEGSERSLFRSQWVPGQISKGAGSRNRSRTFLVMREILLS